MIGSRASGLLPLHTAIALAIIHIAHESYTTVRAEERQWHQAITFSFGTSAAAVTAAIAASIGSRQILGTADTAVSASTQERVIAAAVGRDVSTSMCEMSCGGVDSEGE
eukprot:2496112-Pleurochrysis_carterae.AAC.1